MHSLITLVIVSIPNPPFKVRWGPVNKIWIFWENDYTTGNNNHQVQGILASNSICWAHCLLESLPVGTGTLKILNILSLCVCAAFREARGCPKGMDLRHRPHNYSSTWRGHKTYYMLSAFGIVSCHSGTFGNRSDFWRHIEQKLNKKENLTWWGRTCLCGRPWRCARRCSCRRGRDMKANHQPWPSSSSSSSLGQSRPTAGKA